MNWIKTQITILRHERRAILFLSALLVFLWLRHLSIERKALSGIDPTEQVDSNISEPKLERPATPSNNNKLQFVESTELKADHPIKNKLQPNPRNNPEKKNTLKPNMAVTKQAIKRFDFDPNAVDYKQLLELGVEKQIASNWSKFLDAGARFYKPEDVLKVYGMDQELFDKLLPYLKMKSKYPVKKKPAALKSIELNTADADLLRQLYGIGPKLSERIIKYRDKLGGFHNLEQLKEVYGLPDSTLQHIIPKLTLIPVISKLNINETELEELAKHPYVSFKAAKIIINYRTQHGSFASIEELDNIKIFDPVELKKIKAYLTI